MNMRFVFFDVLRSYLNASLRENERTKYEVSMVKIPRIVIRGPNDRVAISVMFVPRTPMKVALNVMYKIIGIKVPSIIAFLSNFSCPLISCRSSGIDVNPKRAKRTTPIGSAKFAWFHVMRFAGFMNWANLITIPVTIAMIAMTPHVSILFSPFNPSLSNSVMMSQNAIPNTRGCVLPGIIFDRDSPSPTR